VIRDQSKKHLEKRMTVQDEIYAMTFVKGTRASQRRRRGTEQGSRQEKEGYDEWSFLYNQKFYVIFLWNADIPEENFFGFGENIIFQFVPDQFQRAQQVSGLEKLVSRRHNLTENGIRN